MTAEERRWIGGSYEDPFDRVIEALLIGLLFFMPVAFGVVEAWSEEVFMVAAAAISICFCLKVLIRGSASGVRTWVLVPVVLFVAVATLQLIPLPTALVRIISPGTVPEKQRLLSSLLGVETSHERTPISFYPYATRHDLRLVLGVSAIFVVVTGMLRRPGHVMRLLAVIAVVGAGVAALALAQDVFGNDKIYGFVTSPHGVAVSGPFVNHSHYAQFMNLSMGAAVSLICVALHKAFQGRVITPAAVAEHLGSADGRRVLVLFIVIVLETTTIFASLSRGGMISLMISAAFTTVVLASRRRLRGAGWIMVAMAVGAFACILYTGFDAVYERLGTLRDMDRAEGGRWQMVKDVAVAWTGFPVLGTGLGTHEVIYPRFDRSTTAALATHAENEYAQAAEETGAIGLASLIAIGGLVGWSYTRTVLRTHVPIHSAAYGLGFGLMAVLVHGLSDFGQHLPANAVLSAIFCAVMIRLPRIKPGDDGPVDAAAGITWRTRWGAVVALIVVGIVSFWAIAGADAARRGAAHWAKALAMERNLAGKLWRGTDDEYMDLLRHATVARDCQKENVHYGYWLNVYRWQAISRATDPNTGDLIPSPGILDFTGRIASDLRRTLSCCPTFGPAWCVLGQLEMLMPSQREQAAGHIQEGYRLAPCHPAACMVAGTLDLQNGDVEAACRKWRRAVELDNRLFSDVASGLINDGDRPDLAMQIAGDRVDRLIGVANILETARRRQSADSVWSEITRQLERRCREPGAPATAFARLAAIRQRDGNATDAIEYYRQALVLDYSRVDWRLSLASLLADTGNVREALRELGVCLQLRPEYAAAKQLVDRLSVDARLVK